MSALTGMFEFFGELAANNNREWFATRKPDYQRIRAEWIAGMGRFVAALAEEWPAVRYCDPAQSTYRIYRDTRFSPDKTPYKTHIASSVGPGSRQSHYAGIYVQAGIEPADMGIYGGIWQPEAPVLRKLRNAIADNAEEFLSIVSNPAMTALYGPAEQWCGSALKTAPKGFDKDHEMIVYLRLKDLGKFHQLTPADFLRPDWPEHLASLACPLIPLIDFINYSIDE